MTNDKLETIVSEGSVNADFRFDGVIIVERYILPSLNIYNMLQPSLKYVELYYVPY